MTDVDRAQPGRAAALRLTGHFTRVLIWYLLTVALLWAVGVEAIYGHPTPFYALYYPAFKSGAVPWAMALLALLLLGLIQRCYGFQSRGTLDRRRARYLPRASQIAALVLFVLACFSLYEDAVRLDLSVLDLLKGFWLDFRWHLLAMAVFTGGLATFLVQNRQPARLPQPAARQTFWWLFGACAFYVLFACAIAMLRNGPEGIFQAYNRQAYEYIGDIGKTRSIRDLFARYLEIHPYLSMHAKVHPPGPIALLWLMSYVVTQSPAALSLATILFGAVALVPLFLWAQDLGGTAFARTATLLYALSPSIVLFTATSADILFPPFTITTLFLFDRALQRGSWKYAVAAGAGFGCMTLLKFSLIGIGVYFALVGLWQLRNRATWIPVVRVAAFMLLAVLGLHLAVYLWSGFDFIGAFQAARTQFDLDQTHLDELSPRFPAWSWRILNPLAWFFFAGIPLSLLFIWRLVKPAQELKARFMVFLATLAVLDLLYLARGEGERSALYIIPFLALPAAHLLQQLAEETRSIAPIAATLSFLAFQCWLIESYFYTYW